MEIFYLQLGIGCLLFVWYILLSKHDKSTTAKIDECIKKAHDSVMSSSCPNCGMTAKEFELTNKG